MAATLDNFTPHKHLPPQILEVWERIQALYGSHLKGITLLPNYEGDSIRPNGFVARFDNNSPMFADIFDTGRFLTHGTCVVRIKSEHNSQWRAIHSSPRARLVKCCSGPPVDMRFTFDSMDETTYRDRPEFVYSPSLGDCEHSMAGIFSSTLTSDNSGEKHMFIVITSHLPELSKDIVSLIESNTKIVYATSERSQSPNGGGGGGNLDVNAHLKFKERTLSTNMKMEAFMRDPRCIYARNAGIRNRLALAVEIARTFGFEIETRVDEMSSNNRLIAIPTIDQQTYSLVRHTDGDFLYYSNAVQTLQAVGGTLLQLSPRIGCSVFIQSGKARSNWHNHAECSFPASMARILHVREAYSEVKTKGEFPWSNENNGTVEQKSEKHVYCWEGNLKHNDKLSQLAYQKRDKDVRLLERLIGIDGEIFTEMHLMPIFVCLAPTDPNLVK